MKETTLKTSIIVYFSEEVLAEFIDWDTVSYKLILKVPKSIVIAILVVSQSILINKMMDALNM